VVRGAARALADGRLPAPLGVHGEAFATAATPKVDIE